MKYVQPSNAEIDQAEAEIRAAFARYGKATGHPSRITKARCEAIAASLDNCELIEEGITGLLVFSTIGPRY